MHAINKLRLSRLLPQALPCASLLFLVSTFLTGCGGGASERPQGSRTVGPIEFSSAFTELPMRAQVVGNWRLSSSWFPPQNSYPHTVELPCPTSIGQGATCGDNDTVEFKSDGTLSYSLWIVVDNQLHQTSGTGTWSYTGNTITFSPGFGNRITFTLRRNPTDDSIQFVSTDSLVGRTLSRL